MEFKRTLFLSGARVAFADEGPADAEAPWLIVHGLGGNMGEFEKLRRAACATHRVLAVDLPGFGDSTNPAQDYRLSFFAQILEQLVERSGARQVHLVCHSLGGQICIDFALDHDRMVASLTLIDTAGTYDRAEWVRWALKNAGSINLGSVDVHLFPGAEVLSDERQPLLRRIVGGNPIILASMESMRRNLHQRATYLVVPTLIVWGTDDPVFDVANAFYLRDNIEGSELRLVDGAGHTPFESHPELLERWITDFHARARVEAPDGLRRSRRRPPPQESP